MRNYFILAAILLLVGCAATKDRKAFVRVISDDRLSEKAFRELEKRHPPRTDSIIIKLPGVPVYSTDTVYSPGRIDTIPGVPGKIVRDTIRVTITKTITDTIRVDKWDNRKLDICIEDYNKKVGELEQLNKQYEEQKSISKKRSGWLIGVSISSVLLFSGLIFARLKRLI